ncbi:PIG-L family deacetylase [Streptomyces sp. NBC_00178]|uniref:sugar-binding protein n=1 Tax=Streptomyces sp. NBC_00178 TaxID=2975672 RepID=UPI002E2C23A5|nr:sugar-binding protein [Streptomyces sp. NBC_00178]
MSTVRRRTVLSTALTAAVTSAGLLPAAAEARRTPPPGTEPAHHDVLFVGAHPDDELLSFCALGQWRERYGWETGVVTVTRGEGGGNAVGPEEGPELGLIREAEEREATALAGIRNIFYLDKPDFWYTLSAPLTARIWDEPDTLERIVRLIRETTPHTVVTMDPRPFDQHGGHQLSARLAVEAFRLAGDRHAFPRQLAHEGLNVWQPRRLLAQNNRFDGLLGEAAAAQHRTDPDSGLPVVGFWSGHRSRRHGTTWAQARLSAARHYRTQGWGTLPPEAPSDPEMLNSEWFTVLADRGRPVRRPVHRQTGLLPLYAEFRGWAHKAGMPWLANNVQPPYPARPTTTVPAVATAPVLNGLEGNGEYPGPELALRYWQGETPTAADCSATAKLSRHDDDLYVLVRVTDERAGAPLDRDDVKRHWRADSVEIALDPRGDADDTSVTFKTGIVPLTADGEGPEAGRDADNHQGPASMTAPGMRVVSTVTEPYRGYTVEVRIPLGELPAAADPERFALNVLVYDSDTDDRTGQTRLAWAPYGSAQADPYVWGTARLEGYTPPADRPSTPARPRIPADAARSEDSPAALAQARRTGVPIAGGPRVIRG